MTVAGALTWEAIKKIGFWRGLVAGMVIFLMTLVGTYIAGDLRAEEAVKQEVVPVLHDVERRLKDATDQLDAIQRLNQMSLDLQVEQCISAAEMADRSSRKCTEIVKPR